MNWALFSCAAAASLLVAAFPRAAEGKRSTRRSPAAPSPGGPGGPGGPAARKITGLGIDDLKFTPLTGWEGGMEDGVLYRGYKTDKDMVSEPCVHKNVLGLKHASD